MDNADIAIESIKNLTTIKNNKGVGYYNIPCGFDIETSSFEIADKKYACMYAWTVGINGYVIFGRTWEELLALFNKISYSLRLYSKKRLVLYVHNLAYEFQWLAKRLNFTEVFATKERKVLYATSSLGIEFRCSYMLSGFNLDKLSEQLIKYPIKKLVGYLDYSKVRHHKTPMSIKEIQYCENDTRVVMAYIQECIENDGSIIDIPLTKTGYVRKYCRAMCLNLKNGDKVDKSYSRLISKLTIDASEYKMLKDAFQGGFTHANAWYINTVVSDVASFDFTSSYPTVMICEKFPMSKGEKIIINNEQELIKNLKYYCCMFDIEFVNLRMREDVFENPLSSSKCLKLDNAVLNNGRVVECDKCFTTLTEQDFFTMQDFYKWDSITVYNFYRYERDYLPTNFVKAILKLYKDKTELKGVEGKEVEYQQSKGQINASYGMTVTDICRDENIFSTCVEDNLWDTKKADTEKLIEKYNSDPQRFLYYPWGVWITAYARRRLMIGIKSMGIDYVYSDTDSIKVMNVDKHWNYFNAYNKKVIDELELALEYHGLDKNLIRPKTITGEEKPLGVWTYEGTYKKFKTLGAKRYLVLNQKDKLELTVSGLNKHICVPYMLEKCNSDVDKVFDMFSQDMYIPKGKTGKNIHTYIDYQIGGEVTDYLGNTEMFNELSCVHLGESDYSLSLSREFVDYVKGIKEVL